ncbi:MAG TPA: sugar phosphate isomerase/epimerase [Opitutaceae bacterium]|nr:sugar phosphate isomerase/epimerase [Opitutaceae bacterium]
MKSNQPPPARSRGALSRRSFLRTAAASTALALLSRPPWSAAQPAPARRKVVVGGHPWVYAATLPGYDITPALPQIFADMSYAGLDGVELMHEALRPDDAVERIGELSRRHQLPVIGMSFDGAMWNREMHPVILKDANLKIPRLARLGGRTLGTSVGPIRWGLKIPKTEQQLDDQADLLRKLIALCERHGVVLNLHNHTYEVENDMHDLRGTLARIPGVNLGPDLNWLVRAGVDPAAFIRQFDGQIVFMHLRDQKKDGRWSEALGEGDTDYVAIGRALHEINFAGDAVIELAHEHDFKPTRPLGESFKMSREFVRRTLGY